MRFLKSLKKNPLKSRNQPRKKYVKLDAKKKFRGNKHIACRNQECPYFKGELSKAGEQLPSCKFVHNRADLDHFYFSDPKFREEPCPQGKECQKLDCKYFHMDSEKRDGKLQQNLLKLKNPSSEQIDSLKGSKGLSFNSVIPSFFILNGQQVKDIASTALDCLKYFSAKSPKPLPKNKQWHSIHLNLLQKKCKIVKGRQEGFVEIWKNVSIVNYKSFLFTYNRNSLRNQLSFNIRTAQVVPFVCTDIEKRKASHLKLRIKSLQNKWVCFKDIFAAIHKTKESIYKLDLDICEFIGPIDIDQIEEQFMLVFSDLPNIKVFKLRLEFNFLDGSSYESDILDVVFDSLEPYKKKIISGEIELHLNIFGMILKRKKEGVYFEAEHIDPHKQKALVRRLKNSKIHSYFLDLFSYHYINDTNIKELYVDYSNLFGHSSDVVEREKIRKAYISEISAILKSLQKVLNKISPESLDKAIVKFNQFEFTFENVNERNSSIYTFNYGQRLLWQNQPILNFKDASLFASDLKSRLRIQNRNGVFSGNCYLTRKCKQYQQQKFPLPMDQSSYSKKAFHEVAVKPAINKAQQFTDLMFNRYEAIRSFYYYRPDRDAILRIIASRKNIVDVQQLDSQQLINKSSDLTKYQTESFERLLTRYNFARKRIIATLAAMKKVTLRNPKFKFREEIIVEIMNRQQTNPFNFDLTSD